MGSSRVAGRPGAPWPAVLCLIGLDYFSTLAYQPSIAFGAAGRVAPLACLVLVLVTLLGALPVYAYIAGRSPDGQGAIALLERWIKGWRGKVLVLVLLGFVATDFVITKTISAADAAEHILANPLWGGAVEALGTLDDALRSRLSSPFWQAILDRWDKQVVVTAILLILGFTFWSFFHSGFTRRLLQMAVIVVTVYLVLTGIVVGSGLVHLSTHPEVLRDWWQRLLAGDWQAASGLAGKGNGWAIAAMCFLSFPTLALGLSGFELSMVVMPLVRGGTVEDPGHRVRIRDTRKLLVAAALLMSLFLLGSVLVTSILIPPAALLPGGSASLRALAYLAHGGPVVSGGDGGGINPLFGAVFGTAYDFSTIVILCLAGASVTIGLRDFLPRYLLRLGMELEWAHRIGAILHILNALNLVVIIVFRASVEAQRGAYVTSVVVLLTAAAMATVIDVRRAAVGRWRRAAMSTTFALTGAIFLATTGVMIFNQPEGLFIAAWFVLAILATSLVSRVIRSTEMRFEGFDFQDEASRDIWEKLRSMEFPVLVPHRPGRRSVVSKEEDIRRVHRLGPEIPVVFVEVELGDASDFLQRPLLRAIAADGRFVLRITRCASIAHVIAAVGLELSRVTRPPEIHFGWSEESSITANINFLLFGEGNIPWLVRELIRHAEKDPERQPRVFIG